MDFIFSGKAKRFTYILMAIGLIGLIAGFAMDHSDHHTRWWSNILVNGFYFFAIALGALFFYVLQYATEAAWTAQLKRVFEGIFSYLPIGALVLIIVFIGGSMHIHHLYHWMDPETVNPENVEHYDYLLAGKSAYLNQGFFWARTIVYLVLFLWFARWFRKRSLEEDQISGTKLHYRMFKRSAIFLVVFAVFSSTLSWDWLMSIDPHWFSTLYGWYVFSGMWVSAMIVGTLLLVYLKSRGYLKSVNDSHIHDMGKWMFAVSMLWSYLWFSQFMLIWYSNIPEEVTYFVNRIDNYKIMFFGTFLVNFLLPFWVLMARDAKRNPKFLVAVGLLIFLGHFVDTYLLVIPGTMFDHHHVDSFSIAEVAMFLGFVGLFIHVILRTLTKAPLIPVNHPFLQESEHHSI